MDGDIGHSHQECISPGITKNLMNTCPCTCWGCTEEWVEGDPGPGVVVVAQIPWISDNPAEVLCLSPCGTDPLLHRLASTWLLVSSKGS